MEDDALKIIDELNFEELHNIKKDYKNNEFFLIGKIKGRDVFLKISNKKNKTRMDQFRREELVDQILEKHNKDIKKPLVVKTDIFGFGENKNYVWVARKFYPGQTLAPFNPGKTLFGYDLIRPSFLLSREKIMKKIIENIEAIYSLETDFRKLAISHSEFPRRYKSNLLEYNIKTIKEELGQD
ncbi:MAG: hypothetical protein NTY30_03400 [Candidatus Berkelbacteria bacterium]|nr:hypothetical protein [Candidatus Berkelbacteria bacterium]